MLKVENTYVSDDGKTVNYQFDCSSHLKKFFTEVPFYVRYDRSISEVPVGILNLPLLANLLPISWFVGFDIHVDELDRVFYHQVSKLKRQFEEYHPIIKTKTSNLVVKHLSEPSNDRSDKKAMLYSGGADAYSTLLRHFDEVPDLISVQGVDMALGDEVQWNGLLDYNNQNEVIKPNVKHYIVSSLRKFISFEVNRMIDGFDWYGMVQHGLALTCLTAPLAYLNNYSTIYIASSFDRREGYDFFLWGSLPEIDNLIKFNNTEIYHDGTELTRQDKIRYIVEWTRYHKRPIQLRVCYSNKTKALNCNQCSKCLMTIFAILNTNENPNNFGFQVDLGIFDKLKNLLNQGFGSPAKLYLWKEVYLESQTVQRFNYNEPDWKQAYIEIDKIFQTSLSKPLKGTPFLKKLKVDMIYKFPTLFNIYLKVRKNLS